MMYEAQVEKNFGKILYMNSIDFIDPEEVKHIDVIGHSVNVTLNTGKTYTLKNILRVFERYYKSNLLSSIYQRLDVPHSEFESITKELNITRLEYLNKRLDEFELDYKSEDIIGEALIPVLDEEGKFIDVEPLVTEYLGDSLYEPLILQESLEEFEIDEREENSNEKYLRLFEEGRARRSPLKID